MDKDNISKFDHCYGCGVCVSVCPVKIIGFRQDDKGFYSPYIEENSKCIECGICVKICAFNHDTIAISGSNDVSAFAAYSSDDSVRQRCSSGGVGFEIGKLMLSLGYKACGVRYNPPLRRAEHFIASTVEEFQQSVGSKYIPSYSSDAFSAIIRREKNLVTGTPCQIDSFRRLIRHFKVEDNFVLLDFFCHGVPSLLLWDKYLSEVEAKIGKATFVSWRDKSTGWHDSWAVCADNADNQLDWYISYSLKIFKTKHLYQSRHTQGDLFYKFFLGNYCLNECCYKDCKYKMIASAADIRIGDLWGKTYADDTKGTSAVIAFTEKGHEIVERLQTSSCQFEIISPEIATEGQMMLPAKMPWVKNIILKSLKTDMPLSAVARWCDLYQISILPGRAYNKLKKIIKHK